MNSNSFKCFIREWYPSINIFLRTSAILLVALSFSCSDRRPIDDYVVETPHFQPFLIGRQSFRGIYEDLDSGAESFAFRTSLSRKAYFEAVSKAAKKAGWQKFASEEFKQVYRLQRTVASADGQLLYTEITLTYNPQTSEVIFLYEP